MRRAGQRALTILALAACSGQAARIEGEAPAGAPSGRPNIVLVLLDDLELEGLAFMPRTRALVGDSGITLHNAFVSAPLCCPSRVSLLRGQYPHNTGVVANGGANGGFAAAYRKKVEQSTVATWLSDAGYRTALFGKYLNFYPAGASKTYVPPGWTEWGVPVEGTPYAEFNYALNLNGRIRQFGHDSADYGTDVYVGLSEAFIRRSHESRAPFFLLLAPFAPHGPATPAPRHQRLFSDATIPETPSRSEEDVSDKPPLMHELPRILPATRDRVTRTYRNRLRSLQAVDEGVERLINVLRELGALESTLFIVSSDNGFHLLDHRLLMGKETAYEMDIRVPFVARGPGIPRGAHSDAIVLNNDLAPTFAELAGAAAPGFVDGRSIVSLLQGKDSTWRRERFLVTRRLPETIRQPDSSRLAARVAKSSSATMGIPEAEETSTSGPRVDAEGVNSSSPAYTFAEVKAVAMIERYPHFNALRTRDGWVYIEHDGGFVELYDLDTDPHQLDNLAVTRPTAASREKIEELATWTKELLRCSAAACREAEDAPDR